MTKREQRSKERLWMSRIEKAIEWRKKFSFEEDWDTIRNLYNHRFTGPGKDLPHFNMIYMMGRTLLPSLIYQKPGIINVPQRPEFTFFASIWDSIDNFLVEETDIKRVIEQATLSGYLYNTTAIQIGYDFSDGVHIPDYMNSGNISRTRKDNLPWFAVIPPHRFITAVGTNDMNNCAWAGKLVSITKSELKKMHGLKNVVTSNYPTSIGTLERHIWQDKDMEKWVHFWEIHDATTREYFWLSTNGKFILPPQDDPLQVDGLPFELLSFNENLDSVFGTPDSEYIKSQQQESDEIRAYSRYQRRTGLLKCIYNSNVIKPEDLQRMLGNSPVVGIPAKLGDNGDDDIRRHVHMFLPPNNYNLLREYGKDLLNDAQLINGFGPNQMGTFAPGRRTKYETQVVESNNTSRLAFRRNKVANVIAGLIRRANMLISENWTEDLVRQVVGADGALYWVKVNADQLQYTVSGYSTTVNVESLAPVSRERRKAEATNLLAFLGNFQEAGINTLPLIKQLLSCYEWIDVRQVLPEMAGEYELNVWLANQQRQVEQGVGQRAAQNMQGISVLADRTPEAEVNYNNAMDNPTQNEEINNE